jgi:3-dehydroquinate dehydratase I
LIEKCLRELGLPHQAVNIPKDHESPNEQLINTKDFGGAVFDIPSTIPKHIVPTIYHPEALATGLVDTIAVVDDGYVGYNCVAQGIKAILTQEYCPSAFLRSDVLVVGSSYSETASLIWALLELKCGKIYTIGFSIPSKVTQNTESCQTTAFKVGFNLVGIFSTLPVYKSRLLVRLIRVVEKFGLSSQSRPRIFMDINGQRKDPAGASALASGLNVFTREDISAAVMVARLSVLARQSVPYDFVRMVKRRQLF